MIIVIYQLAKEQNENMDLTNPPHKARISLKKRLAMI
jgi:hypothetical protein